MKTLSLRLPDDLAARVEAAKGDVPWNRWFIRAAERILRDETMREEVTQALESVLVGPQGAAEKQVRRSSQAKRDVQPRPKQDK